MQTRGRLSKAALARCAAIVVHVGHRKWDNGRQLCLWRVPISAMVGNVRASGAHRTCFEHKGGRVPQLAATPLILDHPQVNDG